jgi:hypothetical protein
MSDCIYPLVQFLKGVHSVLASGMIVINFWPKLDTEKPEIGSNATGLGVLAVELATLGESSFDQVPNQCGRIDEHHKMGDAFCPYGGRGRIPEIVRRPTRRTLD